MSHISVLMYHALYANDDELMAIAEEDRPYAVSTDRFVQQLSLIQTGGYTVLDARDPASWLRQSDKPAVLLTFDDAHRSNYVHALPMLKQYGMSALFFVTTGWTNKRDDYCNWDELREMSDQGMGIGTHGETHRFLSDLETDELTRELVSPLESITTHIKGALPAIAFPGGRYNAQVQACVLASGYRYYFDSRPGLAASDDFKESRAIKRFAIRRTTSDDELRAWLAGRGRAFYQLVVMAWLKSMVKKVLGNGTYHRLYQWVGR